MGNTEIYSKLSERKIGRTEIYDGAIAHLVVDKVLLPNGNTAKREVILHNGAVCVVPITDEGEIIMERQFRYPFDSVIWEIPAGKLDKNETSPLEGAMRELKEETGYTAANYKFIGLYYPSPAILSEKIYMYVATGLSAGERDLDEDEFLDVVKLPFDKVVDMIPLYPTTAYPPSTASNSSPSEGTFAAGLQPMKQARQIAVKTINTASIQNLLIVTSDRANLHRTHYNTFPFALQQSIGKFGQTP